MPIRPQPPLPEQQQTPYLPPGPEPLMFEQFQGINTSTTRPGVQDKEMWWSDGFLGLGPRDLRTVPGTGTALWNVSQASTVTDRNATIVFYNFANIASTPYCIVFLSSGSIYAINANTGTGTAILAATNIQNPSQYTIGMTQWGNQYIVIVALQTNGYYIWDGTTMFGPGDSFGGGTVPIGLGGNAVEIYAGRVWVATGPVITFSAPGDLVDFSSGAGGGQFQSTDSFLRISFTQLKQSNGFLYLIGDSSVNYISGVQTSGSPLVTTFTNQNADTEVGTPWPNTVTTFGRNIMLANAFGAHVSYGAAVTKISDNLDGVYSTVPNFGGLTPSAAKAIIYGKKVWVLLLPIINPFSGQQENKLFLWYNKFWFPTPQDISLTFIQSQEIASFISAWGTNGTAIYPLFKTPSIAFEKVVQSRFWDTPVGYQEFKAATRFWALLQFYNFVDTEVTVAIDSERGSVPYDLDTDAGVMTWINASDDAMTWLNASSTTMTWLSDSGQISVSSPQAVGQQGVVSGLTFSTNCADMALISGMLQTELLAGRF